MGRDKSFALQILSRNDLWSTLPAELKAIIWNHVRLRYCFECDSTFCTCMRSYSDMVAMVSRLCLIPGTVDFCL